MTKLWSLDEIAEYSSYGLSVARKLVAQPDFPRPTRLMPGSSPRWFSVEVIAWVDGRKKAGRALYEEGSRYTALYRHYNKDGRLLYVGVSVRVLMRLAEHRMGCAWYRQIAKIEIEWFNSRDEAMAAEAKAIREERPLHNISLGLKAVA